MKAHLKILLILILILLQNTSFSQYLNWDWARQSVGLAHPSKIVTDRYGNAYYTGTFGSNPISFGTFQYTPNIANPFIYLVKYDSLGNEKWAKFIGPLGCDARPSIGTDSLGNVYLSDPFTGTVTIGNLSITDQTNVSNALLVKFDSSGNEVWLTQCGGELADVPYDITVEPDGSTYMAGRFTSTLLILGPDTINNPNVNGLMFLTKFDSAGNIIWGRSTKGTNISTGDCITRDQLGHIFICGMFNPPFAVFETDTVNFIYSQQNYFITKYDNNGNVIWARNDAGGAYIYDLDADRIGNVYATGIFSHWISNGNDTINNVSNTGDLDMFVVKYDHLGNKAWAKSGQGSFDDIGYGIDVDDYSNHIYVTARFDSSQITFANSILYKPINAYYPMAALVLDSAGNVLNHFVLKSGGHESCVRADGMGSIYIGGFMITDTMQIGLDTLYPVNDPAAVFITRLNDTSFVPTLSIPTNTEKRSIARVFPNPSQGKIFFTAEDNKDITNLCIFDITGNKIFQNTNSQNTVEADISKYSAGIYYYHILIEGELKAGKIIVQ